MLKFDGDCVVVEGCWCDMLEFDGKYFIKSFFWFDWFI